MAILLLAGIVCSAPKNLNPANGRPHMVFLLRAEGDGQVWKISALDEREVGVERLSLGDAVAVTGHLDIGIEVDKAGNRRIAYRMEAHQILLRPALRFAHDRIQSPQRSPALRR